ncbi:hypothetical protein M8C21_020138 [Ambrosia artemisiifolia]|uniref:Ion transport domain-containing protein n=1 Tax=Ambrosia artemisiifolia TaxID=4212 RepID=A0AAD5GYL1_AMBAR|nr:hypothetical protein M8C21_020138 [Ambrosia artemisiifolia]
MMDDVVKDDVPMSSVNWSSHKQEYNLNRKLSNRNRHVSISIPVTTSTELTSHSKENIIRVHHELYAYRGANRWVREKLSLIKSFAFGVMNPHATFLQKWNQLVIISCLFAIFLDPVFVYLMSADKERKCIAINWQMTKSIVILRSTTDFIYFLHMLIQLRLAYVKRGGDLVDHPRRIALHYLSGYFFLDLFIVLPLLQINVLLSLPSSIASSGATGAQFLLQSAVLVQNILKLCRFQLLARRSSINSAVESTWANFGINLLTFVFAAHVVGSCWYLFGLQVWDL